MLLESLHIWKTCQTGQNWIRRSDIATRGSRPIANSWQQQLEVQARDYTRKLRDLPYEPSYWLLRGQALLELGYPELAVGDVHKSRLLSQALRSNKGWLSEEVRLQHCMRVWVEGHANFVVNEVSAERWQGIVEDDLKGLEEHVVKKLAWGLLELKCLPDCIEICKAHVKAIGRPLRYVQTIQREAENLCRLKQKSCDRQEKDKEKTTPNRNGKVLLRPYPWVPPALAQRNPTVIQKRKMETESASKGKCSIVRSPMSAGFGIVALKDIRPEETVLEDASFVIAVNNHAGHCTVCCSKLRAAKAQLFKCCKLRVCSAECGKEAARLFHKAVCGTAIIEQWQNGPQDVSSATSHGSCLFEKVLSILVQSKKHPLLIPIINQLVAPYSSTEGRPFNFGEDIVRQFDTLQKLNVDIFADQRFDTWILHTVRTRLVNNAHGDTEDVLCDNSLAVHSIFSFFNHSCMPNVYWDLVKDKPNTQILKAHRKIRKGEELTISYLLEGNLVLKREERQLKLASWLTGGCQCQRCHLHDPDVTLKQLKDLTEDQDASIYLNSEDHDHLMALAHAVDGLKTQ